ncbi:ABC transporter permease [Naumannella halotolerans]|uniref:Glycine betaine/proline transport system permease protein n=1 Tax=Naumannella halotolerans TaxID=993414 RepID=A0A4R7J5X6_9ACTN|nr:ABC transporter permease subunit [Naumannella halotolerans]TDT32760.1 glycine betaine/proline transport system permease protein [Naumannella halotolerans]
MDFMNPRIPLGDWVSDFIDWFNRIAAPLLDGIDAFFSGFYDLLYLLLSSPLYLIMIVIFAALAWLAAGWRVALFTVLGFYLIRALDQWNNAMSTLALVLVACVVAIAIAVPLGILAAKVRPVSAIVRPVLDFMQSMPALAYLVPAIVMFGVGTTPGAIATIIFALPPGVRLTELAIRQVDGEVVEAGQAFGATPGRILTRIQLPLAMPTIMAGINQVIMLALSMVVLAGMAGAGGLGGQVTGAISRVNVGLGVEAGLAVVIIAVFLDRITGGLGNRTPTARAQRASR